MAESVAVRRLIETIEQEARRSGLGIGKIDVVVNVDDQKDVVPALQAFPSNGALDKVSLGILKVQTRGQDALLPLCHAPVNENAPDVFQLDRNERRQLEGWARRKKVSLAYLESLGVLQRGGETWRYRQFVVDGALVGVQEIYLLESAPDVYTPWVRIGGSRLGNRYRACWQHVLPGTTYRLPIFRAAWLQAAFLEDPFNPETQG